jgi:hypothetical protein
MNPSLEKTVSLHAGIEYNSILKHLKTYEKAEEGNRPLLSL